MNEVDLHCHTTASDGALDPAQLIQRASRLGVKVIAVTDHDSTDGVEPALAAGQAAGVEVIPGVEINTDVPGGEVHVLGYFVNHTEPGFQDQLARLRDGRLARARQIVDRLGELGAPISLQRVLAFAGHGSIGRPHVAQALVEAGHATGFADAFDKYIGRHSPAYVERMRYTPAEACGAIRAAGGVPVLAHPISYGPGGVIKTAVTLDVVLPELIGAGLMGIEVYYGGYDAITSAHLMAYARRYGLLITGGSDFHGLASDRAELASNYVPMKVVHRLHAAWESLGGSG